MGIDEINAMGAGIVCGGIEIESVVRKGSVVLCDSVTFPIEKVFVEFEDEHLAISFVEGIKTETAIIALDEKDVSIKYRYKRQEVVAVKKQRHNTKYR